MRQRGGPWGESLLADGGREWAGELSIRKAFVLRTLRSMGVRPLGWTGDATVIRAEGIYRSSGWAGGGSYLLSGAGLDNALVCTHLCAFFVF